MKVISVTPAGRKIYLEILVPYLLKNRAYIAEHHFWLNTENREDIAYIESVAQQYPDFFKINRKKVFDPLSLFFNIWQYFKDYTDEDTLYIRLDDDICYIADDAIPKLIDCRLKHPEPFLVYGNVVNNTFCSYLHQKNRVIPRRWHTVKYGFDLKIVVSSQFAAKVHLRFILSHKLGLTSMWKFKDHPISLDDNNPQVNVISWFGKDFKGIPELDLPILRGTYTEIRGKKTEVATEEQMLLWVLPHRFNRPNMIAGQALFSHFAYTHQRWNLEHETYLLEAYKNINHLNITQFVIKTAKIKWRRWRFLFRRWNRQRNWAQYPARIFIFCKTHFPKTYKSLSDIKRKISGIKK